MLQQAKNLELIQQKKNIKNSNKQSRGRNETITNYSGSMLTNSWLAVFEMKKPIFYFKMEFKKLRNSICETNEVTSIYTSRNHNESRFIFNSHVKFEATIL